MNQQHSMTNWLPAVVCAALMAIALSAFTATQSAYAELTVGDSPVDTITAQSETSTAKTIESSTEIYRMYNPNSGEHFYTGGFDEAMYLTTVGWNYEGVGWVSETKADGEAVYRVYNPNAGDHHYTTSKDEKDNLVEKGWTDEGISFYSAKSTASNAKAVYRQYNPNATTGAHNFTMSTSERDNLVSAGWKNEDISWYAFEYSSSSESIDSSTSVYRMYNPNSGEHFYTCSKAEVASLIKAQWTFEKAAWTTLASSDANAIKVYRVYNKNNGDHHYTVSESEKNDLVSQGWTDEGVAFYCADKDSTDSSLTDIYRLYNPSATGAGSHFFTPDSKERDALVEISWRNEGVAWKAKSA